MYFVAELVPWKGWVDTEPGQGCPVKDRNGKTFVLCTLSRSTSAVCTL